jgi:hypothetical protein
VSDQAFERSVGEHLRARPDLFAYHPPDDPATRQWKPCDFLVCVEGRFIGIECKEVAAQSFPLSRWTSQQRGFAQQINLAGGRYFLLVRFAPSRHVEAFHIAGVELLMGLHGSLVPGQGLPLSTSRGGFDLAPMLVRELVYPAWTPPHKL